MSREEVARHQRTRLYGGMIEAVSQRGYADTTVAQVIGFAGVSRRAFYELFSNKEDCFLSTYDIVVARARKLALTAWERERGWANRLHAAVKAVLDHIAKDSKGPRLVLVDSLGVGPRARERMQLAASTFERIVAAGFAVAPDGIELSPLTTRAIVGGARHVAFTRMFEGRQRELLTLTDELLDWIESYRSPLAARLTVNGLVQPPPVPAQASAFLAKEDKRTRAMGALVHLTLDEGYRELTDPQIAQFAGISTEAFHRQFPNKADCFMAVMDEYSAEALAVVRGAMERADSWEESVHLAVGALIEHLVSHEALTRLAFIDVFEVGPVVVGQLTRSIEAFTALLAENGPQPRRAPLIIPEALTGALWWIIASQVANRRLRYLPCMTDQIAFVLLAPYVGPKEAMETIVAAARRRRELE